MFPLIESIQILDGQPQNLKYHQYRFEASYFKMFKQLTQIQIKDLIEVPDEYLSGLVKLRFLYNQTNCFCQYIAYTPKIIQHLKVVRDDAVEYNLKKTDRRSIDRLLLKKGQADDILIVKHQRLTDSSFTNIVLYDGQTWWTPKYPLLHGTARSRLIDQKKINVADILISDLADFKTFKLINAMRDFETIMAYPINNISL